MPDAPEVKVRLTAEDAGVAAAIRQLGEQLKTLKTQQQDLASSSRSSSKEISGGFASIREQATLMVKAVEKGLPTLEGTAGTIAEKFRAAALAIGGPAGSGVAAIVSLGVAAVAVRGHMLALAQSIFNTAAATGLSASQVQEFTELAKEMDLDAEGLEKAFSRIEQQLGKFALTGETTGKTSEQFVRVVRDMGVSVTDASGKLRPTNDILADFADKLRAIPDPVQRAAIELAARSSRGKILAQVIEEAIRQNVSLRDLLASIAKSGNVIPDAQLDRLEKAKVGWDKMGRAIRGAWKELETFIALHPAALLAPGPPGLAAAISEAHDRAQPSGPSPAPAGSNQNVLQIVQLSEENEKLSEKLQILRAGGELQLQLQTAETGRAAALKSGNAEAIKQFDREISQLRQIIALQKTRDPAEIPPLADAAAKAGLALTLKHEQDMLAVLKAGAEQRAEVDREEYDRGELSLKNYFDRRREEIVAETQREVSLLLQERDQVQAAADLAGQQAQAKQAEAQTKSAGIPQPVLAGKAAPTSPHQAEQLRQFNELSSQADRLAAEQIQDLTRVDEIDSQIRVKEIGTATKTAALNADQSKQEEAGLQRELEFRKEIAALQGKTLGLTQAEINLGVEKRTREAQQANLSPEDLAARLAEIEQWKQLTTEVNAFDQAERKEATDQKQFEIEKRGIDLEQKAGLLSRADAEKKISDLIKQRLPLLIQEAEAELQIAQASGNQEQVAKAQETLLVLRNLEAETITWQHELQKAGEEARTSLTSDFANFFETLASGTTRAGKAFSDFGLSILRSLEKIAAQMLANIIITKLMQVVMSKLGIGGGGTQQLAQTVAQNNAMILSNAGAAGAAAFASAMAVTPFPADIPVATAAMGAAISIALSNLALGSAAQGAFLDEDKLIQAHAEEMILPRDIALPLREALLVRPGAGDLAGQPPIISPEIAAGLRASIDPGGVTQRAALAGGHALPPDIGRQVSGDLRSAVESGALSSPAIATPAQLRTPAFNLPELDESRAAGGETHYNFPTHIGSLSALDGASMRSLLEQHGDLVGSIAVAAVKRHFRSNGVNK